MPTLIKAKYTTEDEIPDMTVKELFEQRGEEFVLTQIEGIKTEADVTRVQRSLQQEREARKKEKAALDAILNGRKPEEVLADLERIPELEASTGKIDEEKLHNLVEARIKTRLTPLEREKAAALQKAQELEQAVLGYVQKDKVRSIHEELTAAARKAKVQESAIEDVLLNGERVFDKDETGKIMTADGVTADVWLADMSNRKPHWWGPTAGGGGRGGAGGEGIPNNPWTTDNWNLTRQGEIVRTMGSEKAARLAKAAGSSIGATRPPAKK